jgi:hypothetical protein
VSEHFHREQAAALADRLMRMFPDGSIEWADRPENPLDWQPVGEQPPAAAVAVMQKVIDGLHAKHPDPRDAVIAAATALASLVPPPLRIDTTEHLAEDSAYYDARGVLLDRLIQLRNLGSAA